MMVDQPKRDLVLSPGSFAYLQDGTKGVVKVYVGPTSITPSAQETPVIYNQATKRFEQVSSYVEAVVRSPVAVEGYYIVLTNPALGDKHPETGSASSPPELIVGRKIIVPGPAMFALWPGQTAEVIRGHQLRFNQYLLARVYNEEEAQKNYKNAIVKGIDGDQNSSKTTAAIPENLTVGTQFIIRGDQVSFYIPSTGISIVKNDDGEYIRSALTLERLEYCILVDEDGNKRYEKGPKVVFPKPSERFKEGVNERSEVVQKFRAVELNENQGIHIKVISPYTDGGRDYKEGEELFITGKETAIYFPREEHSVIKYEGRTKHFATAVPVGEGRYVMNRSTGVIRMVKGPAMLLPDPRTEVLVRRILSPKQTGMWYPGNAQVETYNAQLRNLQLMVNDQEQVTSGALTEQAYRSGATAASSDTCGTTPTFSQEAAFYSSNAGEIGTMGLEKGGLTRSLAAKTPSQNELLSSAPGLSNSSSSRVNRDQKLVADSFQRSSNYTPPRMITLDSKYQGVPVIDVWTGYAVQVVGKSGTRKVVLGPATILLEYDESLDVLELSTGRPKGTQRTFKTSYLRVENNQVSDVVDVETSDHIAIQVSLSFRVNFEGDTGKWFSVENYIKLLTDHARSVLKAKIKKLELSAFYSDGAGIIREIILGKPGTEGAKRPGMLFEEVNMRVTDVEVLKVHLYDNNIRALLEGSQLDVVRGSIQMDNDERSLEIFRQREEIKRQEVHERAETLKNEHNVKMELIQSELALSLAQFERTAQEQARKREEETRSQELQDLTHEAHWRRVTAERDLGYAWKSRELQTDLEYQRGLAETVVQRLGAILPGFSEALLAMSRDEVIAKVASSLNIQQIIGGNSVADALNRAFQGTGLEGKIKDMMSKIPALPAAVGNGSPSSYPPKA
jgi:major vault protein